MVSSNMGLILFVGLFVVTSAIAIYMLQSQGGFEALFFNSLQLTGGVVNPSYLGTSYVDSKATTGDSVSNSPIEDPISNSNQNGQKCIGKSYATLDGKTTACVDGKMTEKCTKEGEIYVTSNFLEEQIICENGKWVSKPISESSSSGSSGSSGGSSGSSGGSSGATTGTQTYYCDEDSDGQFGQTPHTCSTANCVPSHCTTAIPGYPDCDDNNKNTYVGAVEYCDGFDNDCDKVADEADSVGCTMYYYDGDQDGYGKISVSVCSCSKPSNYYVGNSLDCVDTQESVFPGAIEICNGKDDDCDGQIDEGVCTVTYYYHDYDGDGYTGSTQHSCTGPNCVPADGITQQTAVDCNDNDAAVYPGATESCNGKDDNCDSMTDMMNSIGCTNYYYDLDKDGYGSPDFVCLCSPSEQYSAIKMGDCNSNTAEANPGMQEKCDGIDNNCDDQIDEYPSLGCTTYYYDYDGDGWGTTQSRCLCKAGVGPSKDYMFYTAPLKSRPDCNDNNANIFPGATEICENHADDDCDGKSDYTDTDCQGPT